MRWRWILGRIVVFLLSLALSIVYSVPSSHAYSDCTSSQFTVESKSNSVFYIDSGGSPSFKSNYLEYKITNKTGADITGYSAKIENFSAGSDLSIATYEDAQHGFLRTVANNDFVNMFWYLTAARASNSSSTLEVVIYDSSNVAVCKVTQTISKIDGTIAANANKVTSVIYSSLPTANINGSETFTATIKGQTGTIGAGPTGTRDVNLSPSTAASFAARNFRLSATKYTCGGTSILNALYIPNACAGNYTAVFTYQYLQTYVSGTGSNVLSPIMQISSGTQMKHTGSLPATIAEIGSVPTNQVTTYPASNIYGTSATLNGSNDYGTYSTVYFCWSSTSPGSGSFANNCTNKITAISTGTGSYYANLSGLTNGTTYYFELTGENSGPTYTKGGVLTFVARAYAVTDTATSITYTTATLNGHQSGISSADVDTVTSYFYYTTTNPGSGHIDQSTATQVALNSTSGTNASFTAALTGLSQGTKYYFEISVNDGTNSINYIGGVRNFTTTGYQYVYDGSGASGTAPLSQTYAGTTLYARTNTFSAPSGKGFGGWCSVPVSAGSSCTGTTYAENAALPTPGSPTVTLYAIWESGRVTLSYNGNGSDGGSLPGSQSGITGDTVTVSSGTQTRTGYTFISWNETNTATGTNYDTETVFTLPASSVVFYAKWSPNRYVYDANTGTGAAPSDQVYADVQLTGASNSFTAPSGYSFDGWCTAQPAVGTTCGGTVYQNGDNLPIPGSPITTLYAIWKTINSGNSPAPTTPSSNPPVIYSISALEVCANGTELTINGAFLRNATANIDGTPLYVISSSQRFLTVQLPNMNAGSKVITVTNSDGSTTVSLKYTAVNEPVYKNYQYPEMYRNLAFSYIFHASDANLYQLEGKLPAGLTLNSTTGEVSGTPTVEGNFNFTIAASNICGITYLDVSMFIDKPIPNSFSCSLSYPIANSNSVTAFKLNNLRNCLDEIIKIGPSTIDPVIYLSGGVPTGLTTEELLNHPRYLEVCKLLNQMGIIAQIMVGVFDGPENLVQIFIYWPGPSNV